MTQIKVDWLTISIVAVVAVGIGIYFLTKQSETENRRNIDRWFEERLAISLAEKLGKSSQKILQTIRGSGNPTIIARIREIVNSARLTFTKLSSFNDVEIRLSVDYSNGTSFAVSKNWKWDELPETIRSEFLRSSSNLVTRPWDFPWDN
ncbi:hypothetical protein [Okeania sp. KiyG1]|uniref:hypothetical protein n=1 Tax=Okeania sp. KiyG1 TaxID=2720165 RepID=UPI0019237A48|nr:hypothetical protein [Okeania sp. KiyG1]GGA18106.1 hypothetical protein CYANOKiyG1_32430 [Okeania sp. KiyG1]